MTEAKKYASKRVSSTDYPIYNDEYELELAFEEGAKWQKNHVWHEPDEKPYNKDKRLTLEALRRPLLCAFEDHFAIYLAEDLRILTGVKKWAYVDELIPFELEQL